MKCDVCEKELVVHCPNCKCEISLLERKSEWINAEKLQPPYNQLVLMFRKNFPIHMGYTARWGANDYFVIANTQIAFPATHWMQLPEIPEENIRAEWGGSLRCVTSEGRDVNMAEELNRMETLKNNE